MKFRKLQAHFEAYFDTAFFRGKSPINGTAHLAEFNLQIRYRKTEVW